MWHYPLPLLDMPLGEFLVHVIVALALVGTFCAGSALWRCISPARRRRDREAERRAILDSLRPQVAPAPPEVELDVRPPASPQHPTARPTGLRTPAASQHIRRLDLDAGTIWFFVHRCDVGAGVVATVAIDVRRILAAMPAERPDATRLLYLEGVTNASSIVEMPYQAARAALAPFMSEAGGSLVNFQPQRGLRIIPPARAGDSYDMSPANYGLSQDQRRRLFAALFTDLPTA